MMRHLRDVFAHQKWPVLLMASLTAFTFSYAAPVSRQTAASPLGIIEFDGQLTDKHVNWQYLGQGYRAYSSMLHRLMSQDSLSPFSRGGLNGYVFSANNPVMSYDPSGHIAVNDLLPTTWKGWVGFGAAAGSGSVVGALVGAMATAPFSLVAGVALAGGVGGVSNAIGEYIGQGLTMHQWGLDRQSGGQLANAFSSGAVLGMVTASLAMNAARGIKFFKARYFSAAGEDSAIKFVNSEAEVPISQVSVRRHGMQCGQNSMGNFLSENHAFRVAPARLAKILPGADYDPYFRFKGGRLVHAHTKLRFNDTDDIRTILSVDEATENLTADDHTPASDHTLASNRRVRFRDPLVE